MSRKKGKSSTPRHKRLNRSGRLQAAKHWLHTYKGSNVVHGYGKHFGVDLLCAIEELRMLSVSFDEKYVNQVKGSVKERIKARKNRKEQQQREEWLRAQPFSDETFCFIAGYTDGGVPYGITWEEQKEMGNGKSEAEDGIDDMPF